MPIFPQDQKQPNRKYKDDKVSVDVTPRAKFSDPAFPTSEGDLGILRIGSSDIPRQTRAPSRTGDAATHNAAKMRKVMKAQGMLS